MDHNTPPSEHLLDSSGHGHTHTQPGDHDVPVNGARHKATRGYGKICWYSCLVFLPMTCFSIVILALVYKHQVGFSSSSSDEVPGGFYLVDYPAAKLIFISSWSSSVAPRLISVALGLYLFQSAKFLLIQSEAPTPRLPTPYQLALLINLSTGGLSQLWDYLTYRPKFGMNVSSIVKSTAFYLVVLQFLALLIFVFDSVLHFSTETVPFSQRTQVLPVASSFSQGLMGLCYNGTAQVFGIEPCTLFQTGTSSGLYDASEVTSTINNVSRRHKLLNTTTVAEDGSQTDLIVLGPSSDSVPGNLDYTASTVGVATSCKPISRLCHLNAPEGASTPFNCSAQFWGDVQSGYVNTTAPRWGSLLSETDLTFWVVANFLDANLTQPYIFSSNSNDVIQTTSSWYLGVAVRTAPSAQSALLRQDPDIITPFHGGMAYILGCEINAYNVNYSFSNGSIGSFSTTGANGTITWLFNGAIGWLPSDYMQPGIDISLAETTVADLARTWAKYYSGLAVSIMASVHEGRPNLNESTVQTIIVSKVPIGPLLGLVVLNILFSILGLWLGFVAFRSASSPVAAVSGGLNVEGLVAQLFEYGGSMAVGFKTEECFSENVEGPVGRVALSKIAQGRWILEKKLK